MREEGGRGERRGGDEGREWGGGSVGIWGWEKTTGKEKRGR